jgi:bisphosphoglycerate-dependent phosphoglycerate mutase
MQHWTQKQVKEIEMNYTDDTGYNKNQTSKTHGYEQRLL